MEFGYFAMPSHPPERGLKAGHDWDLQTLRWVDELGYTEAWIGEHHTAPWEPHPAPDLLIAQSLLEPRNIRLPPGSFLLFYHHPAGLAKLGPEQTPIDCAGKYWKVPKTDLMLESLRPHIRPFQKPYPPIGVAGVSKGSDTLKLAGEHGFLPMRLNLNPAYVASHWESVEEGAGGAGRTPGPAD